MKNAHAKRGDEMKNERSGALTQLSRKVWQLCCLSLS